MTASEDLDTALALALNRHSAERGSNTPDFILSTYLNACLDAFDAGVNRRAQWYGRTDTPAGGPHVDVAETARRIRNAALEEAAKAAEDFYSDSPPVRVEHSVAHELAAAIRALKGKP